MTRNLILTRPMAAATPGRGRYRLKRAAFYLGLVCIVAVIVLPVATMLFTSLKSSQEIYTSTSFLPRKISFENYGAVARFRDGLFLTGILNSLFVSLSVVLVQVVVASTAGYALARFRGLFFKAYSSLLLTLYMLPISLALIPLFVIFQSINVIDTHFSLFLAYMMMSLPFAIWMFKGFVSALPYELEESAMMEGCSRVGAFLRVIMPLTTPGIASIGIYTFLNCWSEYLMSSIFVKKESLRTVTVMLQFFRQEQFSDWGSLMAAACAASIPMILLLVFTQKYIVAGMSAGAVKG